MFRVVALLSLVNVLVAAAALISCLSVEDKRQIRAMPRFAWVLAILLVPLAGAIAWFVFGRPLPTGGPKAGGWRPNGGPPDSPRRHAPDDDPEFLRSLDDYTISQQDEDLLRKWGEDKPSHEDEPRPRDPGTEP
jgi:Phospholipase_D-nuclease N-terminal